MFNLPRLTEDYIKNKTDEQEKTVWSGVREISPVSIYGKDNSGKDLRKRCVLSLE